MFRRFLLRLARIIANLLLPILPEGMIRALARLLFSKSWANFQFAVQHPRQVQQARLLKILRAASRTEYGRRYGFSDITDIATYQKRVPFVTYDDIEDLIQRMMKGEPDILVPGIVPYFARTSGTTGPAKYIPVTPEYLEEFRTARRVWYRQVAQAFPGLVKGTILTMHSPRIEGTTEGGIPYGSITISTGIVRASSRDADPERLKDWEQLQKIPMSLYNIEDVDTKYYLLMRFALMTRVSLMAAINPSTLILMCRKLTDFAPELIKDCMEGTLKKDLVLDEETRARYERRMRRCRPVARRMEASLKQHGRVRPPDVWPQLCGLLCWKGGSAPFYLRQFPDWFGDLPVMDYGFAATEGSFSVVMSPEGSSGVAAVTGHFLEFVPEEEHGKKHPLALTADQLEVGRRYFVVVTGSHGLYRYDMNDVVEVTGYYERTASITFCHKGGNIISYTGEKISESHVVKAMNEASSAVGIEPIGFCVTTDLSQEHPRYVLAAELDESTPEEKARSLLHHFEKSLCEANVEYAAKRKSKRLLDPVLVITEPGSFERWRTTRLAEGAFDAHVKTPHLSSAPDLLELLGARKTITFDEK